MSAVSCWFPVLLETTPMEKTTPTRDEFHPRWVWQCDANKLDQWLPDDVHVLQAPHLLQVQSTIQGQARILYSTTTQATDAYNCNAT
jgi:hypothetical protein